MLRQPQNTIVWRYRDISHKTYRSMLCNDWARRILLLPRTTPVLGRRRGRTLFRGPEHLGNLHHHLHGMWGHGRGALPSPPSEAHQGDLWPDLQRTARGGPGDKDRGDKSCCKHRLQIKIEKRWKSPSLEKHSKRQLKDISQAPAARFWIQ